MIKSIPAAMSRFLFNFRYSLYFEFNYLGPSRPSFLSELTFLIKSSSEISPSTHHWAVVLNHLDMPKVLSSANRSWTLHCINDITRYIRHCILDCSKSECYHDEVIQRWQLMYTLMDLVVQILLRIFCKRNRRIILWKNTRYYK